MVDVVIENYNDLDDTRLDITASYILANDLDALTAGYVGIADPTANGNTGWEVIAGNFTGTFNGDGHSILFHINRPTVTNQALFYQIYTTGVVKNLTTKGSISAAGYAGGVAARVYGESGVTNFYRCKNETNISITKFNGNVGGICGVVTRSIVNTVIFEECVNTGNIEDTSSGGRLGGICGGVLTNTEALNCYNTGTMKSVAACGGIFGFGSSTGAILNKCYSSGLIDSVSAQAGGLAGGSANYAATTNSFWDTQTSGKATSFAGVGKTTAEMQTESTFTGAGWDFTTIWVMDDYPELQWAAGPTPPPSCAETPFNPLDKATNITLSNSDLTAATNAGNISWRYVRDTQGLTRAATGRQFEIEVDVIPNDHGIGVGFCNSSFVIDGVTTFLGTFGGASIGLISQVQTFVKAIYYNGSIVHTLTNYIAVGDKIGVSLYSDRVEFMLNGVLIHTETDSMSGVLYPTWGTQGNGLGQSTIHTLDTSIVFKDSGADQWAGPCSPAIVSDKSFTSSFVSGFLTSLVR